MLYQWRRICNEHEVPNTKHDVCQYAINIESLNLYASTCMSRYPLYTSKKCVYMPNVGTQHLSRSGGEG
jgi:hypothetical protein